MEGFGTQDYDFAVGKVVGQRSWKVRYDGQLDSVSYTHPWVDGENRAYCTHERRPGVCFPFAGCGFWAYHNGSFYVNSDIDGVIEGWGKVTQGTQGFRAEKCKIVALVIPKDNETLRRERTIWQRWCHFWNDHTRTRVASLFFGSALLMSWSWTPAFLPTWGVTAWALFGLMLVALIFYSSIKGFVYALREQDMLNSGYGRLTKQQIEGIKRRYPSVKIYSTRKEMLKAHPVDPQLKAMKE
jgi:hypothetical protein